jgi:hypothetical protein
MIISYVSIKKSCMTHSLIRLECVDTEEVTGCEGERVHARRGTGPCPKGDGSMFEGERVPCPKGNGFRARRATGSVPEGQLVPCPKGNWYPCSNGVRSRDPRPPASTIWFHPEKQKTLLPRVEIKWQLVRPGGDNPPKVKAKSRMVWPAGDNSLRVKVKWWLVWPDDHHRSFWPKVGCQVETSLTWWSPSIILTKSWGRSDD